MQFEHSCFDSFTNVYNEYIQCVLKSALDIRIRTRALARFFKWLEMVFSNEKYAVQTEEIENKKVANIKEK